MDKLLIVCTKTLELVDLVQLLQLQLHNDSAC
jgi:hypothetical protein